MNDKIVCVYAGKVGGIYLEQEIFDFFKIAHDHWGNKFRVILLSNLSNEELNEYCKKSKLDPSIIIKKFVPHSEVPKYMGLADFAFTPVKPVNTKRYCTPIKDGEYWALGLPVVITKNISDDSTIIEKNNIGAIISDFTNESYLRAVLKIDEILQNSDSNQRYSKIRNIADQYRSYRIAKEIYSKIYN